MDDVINEIDILREELNQEVHVFFKSDMRIRPTFISSKRFNSLCNVYKQCKFEKLVCLVKDILVHINDFYGPMIARLENLTLGEGQVVRFDRHVATTFANGTRCFGKLYIGLPTVRKYFKLNIPEVELAKINLDVYYLHHVRNKTDEIVRAALIKNGLNLQWCDHQTPELCTLALKNTWWAWVFVKEKTDELEGYKNELKKEQSSPWTPLDRRTMKQRLKAAFKNYQVL